MNRVRLMALAGVAGALLIGIVVLVALSGPRRAQPVEESRADSSTIGLGFVRIDAHAHLAVGSLPLLADLMNKYGFHHIVDLSGGTPDGGLAMHLAQAQASRGRITVFMTFPGRETMHTGYGQRIVAMLERAKQMGAKGFKIPKGLGLGYVGPDGNLVAVDDPGLDPVFEACARLGFPVTIHTADPKVFWQPPTSTNERYEELQAHPHWSFFDAGVGSWEDLLAQLERRVARHPNTTFISVHFGNAAEEPERVAAMLRKYPNLYIDTAARIPEFGRHDPQRMRAFFIEFQDRILYGTDLGVGLDETDLVLGSSGDQPPMPSEVDRFFKASYRYFESADRQFETPTPIQGRWPISGVHLPREVLEKIYARNAHRVLGISMPE